MRDVVALYCFQFVAEDGIVIFEIGIPSEFFSGKEKAVPMNIIRPILL